jgi:hypothetical protein
MKPGRELDLLVATKVMGMPEDPDLWVWAPRYSISLEAAWEVLEKVCKGTDWSPQVGLKSCMLSGGFVNDWGQKPTKIVIIKVAESAPHAICVAALKAMGVDV